MKVNIRKLGLLLLVIATIIPSYWFISGRKILNLIYYATTFLFLIQIIIKRNNVKMKCGVAGIYILSLLLYSIQALWDSDITTSLNFVVSTIFVILIVAKNTRNNNDFIKIIDALLYISLPLLLLAIVEAILGLNPFQNVGLTHSSASFYTEVRLGIHRVNSVFGHPIVYCNYLSIIAALCLYRLSSELSSKQRKLLHIEYSLTILNILLTVSRSVILVFLAEQIILLALKRERWLTKKKLIFLILITIGALISDILGFGILDKVSDIVNMVLQVFGLGSDSYSESFSSIGYSGVTGDRWNLYVWVMLSLARNWVFGRGTTTGFSYMVTEYREKTSIENYYLSTLYHHGIVGLVVLIIGLLGLVCYLCIKLKRNAQFELKLPEEKRITFNSVMLCILIGEIVSYFMVDQAGEARILYVCIGLVIAYNNRLFILRKSSKGGKSK